VRRRTWWGIGTLAATPFVVIMLVMVAVLAISAESETPASGAQLALTSVPSIYAAAIEDAGTMCPILSPPLLAAQLYQESGFNPNAVSSTNAEGIAQFEPGTWPHWAIPSNASPFDPAVAIPAAARYDCALAQQLKGVPGDPVANMLAGYNAGPQAVLDAHGVPPIAQTQDYVRNIEALEITFTAVSSSQLTVSAVGYRAIVFAYDQMGKPYEWGGTGVDGAFDCSGLTQAAYAAAGVQIARVAADQYFDGPHPTLSQLEPGDLVFFAYNLTDPSTIHHVGIYLGNGWMIDAPHTGAVIRYDRIDEADYFGATRIDANAPRYPVGPNASNG
jgi:cell wall-associated NlpC family hydrolase